MSSKSRCALAALTLTLTGLAGCGNSQEPASSPPSAAASAPSSATSTASSSTASLGVADSDFGQIIVDSKQMTAYMFTKDTANSGKSACAGDCLTAWPPIFADSDQPTVVGVTGTVGTITVAGGKKQITVNGWPLYGWAKDKAPGDVTGQGVGGVWYVLSPAGEPIKTEAKS